MVHGCFSPGTTPTHTFTLPFEKELVADLRISYSQDKKVILTKKLSDVEIVDNDINVTLTQEETFQFKSKKMAIVQLKIKTVDGQVFNSDPIIMRVEIALDNEVI